MLTGLSNQHQGYYWQHRCIVGNAVCHVLY